MAVKGVIGKPNIARSNRANQLFFVNKRYVKDKTLTSAAEQGFKGMLGIGKYGFLVLNLEINPQKLDVNVHPAKLEVRFQEENKIFKLVYHAIKEALMKEETDFEKISNTPSWTSKEEEQSSESKGIGGFFKNILNSSKNEFSTNDGNLVEMVYNDKLKKEQNQVEKTEESDGKEESKNIEAQNIENDSEETKESSNLERLVKELEANLEKLNLKPATALDVNKGVENVENLKPEVVDDAKKIENIPEIKAGDTQSNSNIGKIDYGFDSVDKETTDESIVENVANSNEVTETMANANDASTTMEKPEEPNNQKETEKNSEETKTQPKEENTKKSKEDDAKFEEMYAKMFGIDTTLRARSDGTGKFISLPSRKGTDGNFYKEVSCSREVSDLLNQKGLALYDAELNKGRNNKERDAGQEAAQKPAKKSTLSR